MGSFQLFCCALAIILCRALVTVKTEVGPLDYVDSIFSPKLNLDGVLTQPFRGVMQDKNDDFLVAMGGTMIIKFTPGSNMASLIAGLGSSTANGVQATSAELVMVVSLAGDPVGNVYYLDSSRHCVRKIGVDGLVNTFAGTCGIAGIVVDSVAATSSRLNFPRSIFYHTQTNGLYIADTNNHRIRMISTSTNIITTVMGSSWGDLINVVATSARLNGPRDVWVDSTGAIYAADYGNNRIVRATSPSSIATRFAGSGSVSVTEYPGGISALSARIGPPVAITGDTNGNLYFVGGSGPSGTLIYRCSPSNIVFSYEQTAGITGVIDNGLWPTFGFYSVNRILISKDGKVVISDTGITGGYMAQFPPSFDSNSSVSVIAGYSSSSTKSIPAASMLLRSANAVWSDTNGALYVVDASASVIVKSSSGVVTSVAGNRIAGSLAAGSTALAISSRVAAGMSSIIGDTAGNLYYSHGTGVCKISSTGVLSAAAGTSSVSNCVANWNYAGSATSVNLCATRGLALSSSGDELYFSDDAFVIRKLVFSSGILSTIIGGGKKATTASGAGLVTTVYSLWLDTPRSLLYATDELHVVRKISLIDSNPNSTVSVYAGQLGVTANAGDGVPATSSALSGPRGICGSSNGDVYITQTNQFYIRVVYASNQVMQYYVGTGSPGEESGSTMDPVSTSVGPSLACFVDAKRDTLYYVQGGLNSQVGTVRSSTPLAVAPSSGPTSSPTYPTSKPSLELSTSSPSSIVPSQLPSGAPAIPKSPSLTPSLSPSRSPIIPSQAPSITPSFVASTAPSMRRTVCPTASPSLRPSVAPSVVPSASPTTIRSSSAVIFESTWAFKVSNTNGESDMGSFAASSKLRIRKLAPYELAVADQQAIIKTQADYLDTNSKNIVYMSAQRDDVALLIYAKTLVTLRMVDYPELNNNATQLFLQAKSILTEAVKSGSFVLSLLTKAAESNSTSFSSLTITVVHFSDPKVVPAPKHNKDDDAEGSVGQIAGLVVGASMGALLLMLGAYWASFLIARWKHDNTVFSGLM